MSHEESKALVRRFFTETDQGNYDVVEELFTADCKLYFPLSPEPLDREALRGMLAGFYAAFPDLTHTIDAQIAENDRVVTRWSFSGTQRGEFMGIPATGTRATVAGITIDRRENGRIAEKWVQADFLGMMQQLGVIPSPEAAPA